MWGNKNIQKKANIISVYFIVTPTKPGNGNQDHKFKARPIKRLKRNTSICSFTSITAN